MTSCERCGEQNPDRAKFCLTCGAALALRASGEVRKTVTVVFSDLVGSTELGERLDPESLRHVMSRYFEGMQAVLERHGGTVEKFIGDAIMAVFGIPVVHEDDALRALRAASEMRERLRILNDLLERQWGVRLHVRIGINTGEVVAGDASRGQFFVSGDAVNTAARLEQAAAADEILIDERTWALGRDLIEAEPLAPLALKGKSQATLALRLISVSNAAAPYRGHDDSPFLGRDWEMGELKRTLERAIGERTCLVATIVGPPGIGKSRLTREFAESAGHAVHVVSGHCLPYGEGITYWPLAEIVNDIAGDDLLEMVAKLIPDAAQPVAQAIAGAVGRADASGSAAEISWAFRKLFEALAKERPLLAIIDDIHWAEPTLLDLLEYISGFAADAPILLLCLARPELVERRPSWVVPRRNTSLIALQPLSGDDATVLIERIDAQVLSPKARARVAEASEGNPLFIEQLLALNADISGQEDALVVPPSIQALLAARIDRLEPVEKAVLERASIQGRSFHRDAVSELVEEQERPHVGACLISLVRKGFIQPDRAAFADDDGFRFDHMLIRDAAYERVPKRLRADLHERFAVWFERLARDRLADYEEILAYHLEQAYWYYAELGRNDMSGALAERVRDRLATVGLRGLARGDMPAAINLLSRATSVAPAENPRRLELLSELGAALVEAGQLARAEATLREAKDLARANGQEVAMWRATIGGLSLQIWTGTVGDQLIADAEAAATACAQLGDELGLARVWNILGVMRGWSGRSAYAGEAYQTALRHARRAEARREESATLRWLLVDAWFGPVPGTEGIRRCHEILERPIDRSVEGLALVELGCFLAAQGSFEEARSNFGRGHALLEELGQQLLAAGASQELFDIEMLACAPAAAERALRLAIETLERMGEKSFLSTRLGCLAEAVYVQGRFPEAEQLSHQAEEAAGSDAADLDAQFRWRAVRGKALAQRGEFTVAETLVRQAAAITGATDWLNTRAGVQLDLAAVLRLSGRDADASLHMEEALGLYQQKGNDVASARVRKLIAEIRSGGASTVC